MDNNGQAPSGEEHFSDRHEMRRDLPFPYEGGKFPSRLGALIQGTVLSGDVPARAVTHAPDGSWIIGDGVSDPNLPGASVVNHIRHAVQWNSSIADLATMEPGHIAERSDPGKPWRIAVLATLAD